MAALFAYLFGFAVVAAAYLAAETL